MWLYLVPVIKMVWGTLAPPQPLLVPLRKRKRKRKKEWVVIKKEEQEEKEEVEEEEEGPMMELEQW